MPEDTKPPNVGLADAQAQREAQKASVAPESRDALGDASGPVGDTYEYITHRMSADSDIGREFNITGAAGFQFKTSIVAPDNMIIAIFEKVNKAQ